MQHPASQQPVNRYVALGAVYRYPHYRLKQIESATPLTDEDLRQSFLGLHIADPAEHRNALRASLEENYGITDRDSLKAYVESLQQGDWIDGPVHALLGRIYLAHRQDFASLSPEQVTHAFLADGQLQALTARYDPVTGIGSADDETRQRYFADLRQAVASTFLPEQGEYREHLAAFFETHENWLAPAGDFSIVGFNHSRLVDILASAATAGFLSEEEALALINHYGSQIEQLYPDWQTFFFSCLLGKRMLVPQGGGRTLDSDDYLIFVRDMVTAAHFPLAVSGLWPDSELNLIAGMLGQAGQTASAVIQDVALPVFARFGLAEVWQYGSELHPGGEEDSISLPGDPVATGSTSFQEQAEDPFFFNLQEGEAPFLQADTGLFKYIMLTDRGIHFSHRPFIFFGGMRKRFVAWSEPMQFTCEASGLLCSLTVKVNGRKLISFPDNYGRYGLTEEKAIEMDSKKVRALMQQDVDNMVAAFTALREQLAQRAA
ncbi:DUF1266 domain-containing protein [Alcaligenaceae bacterium SJ-26]|nr:DUF1266 domain-containing protein [Alcaligenaceae bacterium SJ-26]